MTEYLTPPAHQEGTGTVVAWVCRLLLLAAFAALVSFAFSSVAAPACGPDPAPNRWPTMIPPLVVAGVAVLGGCILLGRLVRLEAASAWLISTVLTMGALLGLLFFVLLYMSFATLC